MEKSFKYLIFGCGLKSKQEAKIKMCIINKLNESADLTWQQVVEQFNSLVTPKQKVRGMVAYAMEPAV